ncbi:MAG: radical SAM protein, partial [Candidatus Aegiribacteria sp.]|nr:radical SAM protein [Candidatus Aegiribacteria sp.]
MVRNIMLHEDEYIQANENLVFLPYKENDFVVYNPSKYSYAKLSPNAFKIVLYARIPQTVDTLWSLFPEAKEEDKKGFIDTISKLTDDGFLHLHNEIPNRPVLNKLEVPSCPARVVVHLTYRCNLNCRYCYNKGVREVKQSELSYDEWAVVFDEIRRSEITSVVITGGEPFLRRDIFPLIKQLKMYGKRITIGTNGTLITKEDIDFLRDSVDEVNLSIDSYLDTEHDFNRGEGSHAKCVEAAHLLTSSEISWKAQMTYNFTNYKSHAETVEFVKKLGATNLAITVDTSSDDAHMHMSEYMHPKHWIISEAGKKEPLELNITCPGGYTVCALDPQGYIYPCHMLMDRQFRGLSLVDHQLADAWLHSKCLAEIRSFDLMSVAECRNCEFVGLCNGGCRGVAYTNSGCIHGFVGQEHCSLLRWTVF